MNLDLASVSTLIFDLDGVIWRGDAPVEGAVDSLALFQKFGLRCLFATNNSSRPTAFFARKLGAMGIDAAPDSVVTSSGATALYLSRHMPKAFSVFVVGEAGIADALREIGAELVDEGAERADCVVAGIDRQFSYAKLRAAQKFLLGGAKFIATNRDSTFPIEGGVMPGAGSIVAAIATASGAEPLSMGKPEPAMLLAILEEYGLKPEQAAMIGDRLDTDIACANRAGIGAIFVATGVTRMQEARDATGEMRPDACFKDLPALISAMEL